MRGISHPLSSSSPRPSMSKGEALFSDAIQKVSTMPNYACEPATTVRQRSPWLFSKLLYGVVFVMVAVAAYGWKLHVSQSLKDTAPAQATAKVCIQRPNFASQQAWQEVLSQAKAEVRQNLHVETQSAGQQTTVAISLSKLPAESVVSTVNIVASAFLLACRADWKLHLEQAYSDAQAKAQLAKSQLFEAETLLDLLRDPRLNSSNGDKPSMPAQPASTENPRWTEICRRLTELEERRRVLLCERTPLHPSVVEIETRIADMRRELASIPPQIKPEPSAAVAKPSPSAADADIQAARQAVDQARQVLRQAQANERAAFAARGQELQVELLAAQSPPPASLPPRANANLLGKALVTATTSLVGLGMVSLGASLEPAISSLSQLRTLLPVPIVGVIPATYPGRRSVSAWHRHLARYAWVTAGLGVLLAVAWLILHG